MPIAVERVEPRIYLAVWQERINADDLQAASLRRMALADEDRVLYYVSIVDITEAQTLPYNLPALRRAAERDARLIKFVVVSARLQANILIDALIKLTGIPIVLVDSREAALIRARDVLAERDKQEPGKEA